MKNNIYLQKITNIHFIGIGGISLSALAKLMHYEGKTVTGSDITASYKTKELSKLGVKVFCVIKRLM